jgi:hypothetical protein
MKGLWSFFLLSGGTNLEEIGVRKITLVVTVVLVAALLCTLGGTASAQGYTGWIKHPYPNAGYWYCDWYGSEYWCMDEQGNWFRSNPDWYNADTADYARHAE